MNQVGLFCLLGLAALVSAEINQFDYSQHGDNWVDQADEDSDWSECNSSNNGFS